MQVTNSLQPPFIPNLSPKNGVSDASEIAQQTFSQCSTDHPMTLRTVKLLKTWEVVVCAVTVIGLLFLLGIYYKRKNALTTIGSDPEIGFLAEKGKEDWSNIKSLITQNDRFFSPTIEPLFAQYLADKVKLLNLTFYKHPIYYSDEFLKTTVKLVVDYASLLRDYHTYAFHEVESLKDLLKQHNIPIP